MTPGEVMDLALAKVASAAEDVCADATPYPHGVIGHRSVLSSRALMSDLGTALAALTAARAEYLRSTGRAECVCGHTEAGHAVNDGCAIASCACREFRQADRAVSK